MGVGSSCFEMLWFRLTRSTTDPKHGQTALTCPHDLPPLRKVDVVGSHEAFVLHNFGLAPKPQQLKVPGARAKDSVT